MRKINYSLKKVRSLLNFFYELGEVQKDDYSISFKVKDISNLIMIRSFLDKTITKKDTLGFQIDYSEKPPVITVFTDSI